MNKKILIIEDEELIRMALEDDFRLENYNVDVASDGIEGLAKAANPDIDLIILDIMLPGMNGFDICKKLRNQGIRTPVIMLTAKGQEIDRVVGLEIGADDYVTKPFSPRELQSRVKAVLRRMENEPESGFPEIRMP
jgi:DNA-binding response OmpR family regulator